MKVLDMLLIVVAVGGPSSGLETKKVRRRPMKPIRLILFLSECT